MMCAYNVYATVPVNKWKQQNTLCENKHRLGTIRHLFEFNSKDLNHYNYQYSIRHWYFFVSSFTF